MNISQTSKEVGIPLNDQSFYNHLKNLLDDGKETLYTSDGMEVQIIKDSINEAGARVTTIGVRAPKFLDAQFEKHRQFVQDYSKLTGFMDSDTTPMAKSASSSRAMTGLKTTEQVAGQPYIPEMIGHLQKAGMQPDGYFKYKTLKEIQEIIREMATVNASYVQKLYEQGVTKEIANRYIEPYMMSEFIITATEFDNFIELRADNEHAQIQIRQIANMVKVLREVHEPTKLKTGEWHIPLVDDLGDNYTIEEKILISSARCARKSYMTKRIVEIEKDLELGIILRESLHLVPYEHQAQATESNEYTTEMFPYKGWIPARNLVEYNEEKREIKLI